MVRRLLAALLLSLAAVPAAAAHEPEARLTVNGLGTYAFDLPRAVTVDLARADIVWHPHAVWGFWLERADRAPGTPYGGQAIVGSERVSMTPRDVLHLPRGRYVVSTWGADSSLRVSLTFRGVARVRAVRVTTRPVVSGSSYGDQLLMSGRFAVRMRQDRPARAALLRLVDRTTGWLGPGSAAITVPGRDGRRTVATATTGSGSVRLTAMAWPEVLAPAAFEPEFALEGDAVDGALDAFVIVVT